MTSYSTILISKTALQRPA